MIRTWIADIRPLFEEYKYESYYKRLPPFRKEKADRLRFQRDKALSAGVWTLLERIRSTCSITEKAAYNLSHSGDYVLCSVDMDCREQTQVGCDIEAVKTADLSIAERFFCPSEYRIIMAEDNQILQRDLFYRLWVLKESFMKATKEGLGLDMDSFEIQLGSPPTLLRQPERFPCKYYYREYEVPEIPYKIAVCSTDDEIDSEIRMELRL